ncbi:hypothetical protein SDJN02_00529, partial [Cucurbita argyrosperma subsp. argyrosperma]
MASVCISECVDNVCVVPGGRPTHVNLQRCPEEENDSAERERRRPRPRGARRQMYLRSYTFSREDAVAPKGTTQHCLGKLRSFRKPEEIREGLRKRRSRCFAVARAAAKQGSSGGALLSMFRRLVCCGGR